MVLKKRGGRRSVGRVKDVYSQASLAWRYNSDGIAGDTCSKVAIVSYNINSEHMNYGAALHSYAFQKVLQRKGVRSTIVDYYPLELQGYRIKYPILNYKDVTTRKSAIKHILNWGGRGFFTNLRKYRKFAAFFRDHMVKTWKKYTYQDLMTVEKIEDVEYDTFVAESDVIWKNYWKEGYFDDVFYLNIPAAKGKRKVAYAPSMSSRPLTKEELKRFKELTSDYVAISTREKQSAEYLTNNLGREISNLLDPTLLLEDSDYAEIAQRPKQDHYVLLYNCMHNDKEMVLEAERFAVEKNLPLVEVSNWNCNRYMHNHKVVVDAGIEEWLGWFKYADYVICNAFHGACFSVIFKKNFFVFQRDESDYRMLSIVMLLGLEDRLIKCNNKRIPKEVGDIEYGAVYDRLNQERQKSERFIEQYIVNHY